MIRFEKYKFPCGIAAGNINNIFYSIYLKKMIIHNCATTIHIPEKSRILVLRRFIVTDSIVEKRKKLLFFTYKAWKKIR